MAHNKTYILVNYKIFNTSTHITNFNPPPFFMVNIQPSDVLFRVLKSTYTNCIHRFQTKTYYCMNRRCFRYLAVANMTL